jgi:tRNA G18 (ribose-2'-O)-methylase SpoU
MSDLIQVGIPMRGRAESLNLATAAAVVMYALAEKKK